MAETEVLSAIESFFRRDYGRVLAALIHSFGDVDLAEEALGDTLAKAVELWPSSHTPSNPAGWIYVAARRRAVDMLRRTTRWTHPGGDGLLDRLTVGDPIGLAIENGSIEIPDERLRLVFMCCHPALNTDAQVALTLRMIGGLTTAEIADAFLVPEPTLAQRLVRAKHKIREAGIPFGIPDNRQMPDRLVAVLAVVYLVFNEGYFTGTGSIVVRRDLCNEAIRLARLLTELLPNEPEATGLLALLSLQHSRRDARLTENGSLILLEDQDRSRWHLDEIDVARRLVEDALRSRRVGPYQVQAAIAALHAEAMSYAETDWPQIVALYGVLLRMTPSPVIELNRAVAIAMDKGPERGLEAIENAKLGEALDDYRWYHTTLGRLLQKAGRPSEAVRAYQTALSRITNQSEREYVEERLRMLGDVAPA